MVSRSKFSRPVYTRSCKGWAVHGTKLTHRCTRAHTYAHTHACTHARTHTRTHARTHAHTHTHTHARTHTHTYTHTHTHTHQRMRSTCTRLTLNVQGLIPYSWMGYLLYLVQTSLLLCMLILYFRANLWMQDIWKQLHLTLRHLLTRWSPLLTLKRSPSSHWRLSQNQHFMSSTGTLLCYRNGQPGKMVRYRHF